jgi:hypothetical protein
MAGLCLLSVFHHFVGERLGPFNQHILPVFMSGASGTAYDGCRQVTFRNQGSAEELIPDNFFVGRLFVCWVGVHGRLLVMRWHDPFYASIAALEDPSQKNVRGNPGGRLNHRPLKQKANGQVRRKKTDHRSPPHQLALPLNFAQQTFSGLFCLDAIRRSQFNMTGTDFHLISPPIQRTKTSLREGLPLT